MRDLRSTARHRLRDGGLTLIEVAVALGILSIGLLVLLQGFSAGAKSQRAASIDTVGILKAEETFDRLLLDMATPPSSTEGTETDPPGFRWSLETSPADERLPDGPLLRVTFTARWEGVGGERSIALASLVRQADAP